jgi:hypothetical protein
MKPSDDDDPFLTTAKNANDFKVWMKKMKVSSAVYMPLDFSKLPFKVSSLVKVQLAIHEAFHVQVALKYYYTKKGEWPKWDSQPERKKVQSCYITNDSGRVLIKNELQILATLIEALLDKDKVKACYLGNEYLGARKNRYSGLQGVKIKKADDTEIDCQSAESIMELEEGLADFESWTLLFNMGIATKDQLLQRYRALQNDHFYLSGSMLMHAIVLMSEKKVTDIAKYIIQSSSVENGSLLEIFKTEFQKYCNR